MEIQNKGWPAPHGARNTEIREILVEFSASRRSLPEGGTRRQKLRLSARMHQGYASDTQTLADQQLRADGGP